MLHLDFFVSDTSINFPVFPIIITHTLSKYCQVFCLTERKKKQQGLVLSWDGGFAAPHQHNMCHIAPKIHFKSKLDTENETRIGIKVNFWAECELFLRM